MVIQPIYYYLCLQLTLHLCHTTTLSECIEAGQNMSFFISMDNFYFIVLSQIQILNINQ